MVAKGACRARSPWRGLLQPFKPLLLSWRGNGDLLTLVDVEIDNATGESSDSSGGKYYLAGFYCNELLMRLLHRHDPHPRLFAEYQALLPALMVAYGKGDESRVQCLLRRFELQLLQELGYQPLLLSAADSGEPVADGQEYRYVPEQGPFPVHSGMQGVAVCGRTLLQLAHDSLEGEQSLREAKRLMRVLLATHLGPKPLVSRRLFRREGSSEILNKQKNTLET